MHSSQFLSATSVVLATLAVHPMRMAAQTRPTPAVMAAGVDSLARHAMRHGLTPGLGIAVVMDGRVVHAGSYGMADATNAIPVNDHTLWYIASTSKSFTGVAVSLLADRGVIRFEAPITTLLPGVQWHPEVSADTLTLTHFLSHTHHLDDTPVVMNAAFTGAIPEERWPSLLAYAGPTGSGDLVYSNLGYNVAAMVIDQHHRLGWRDFLDREVFARAGMRETYSRVSGIDRRRIAMPHDAGTDGRFVTARFEKTDATMNSAGGHLATIHDLARWTLLMLSKGRLEGRQVFPASAVERSQQLLATHTREASRRFGPFDRLGWAAGWDIGSYEGEPMVSRFGGYHSTRSHLSFLPGRGIGVVAEVNGSAGSGLTDVVAAFAYDMEAGRPDAWQRAQAGLDRLVLRSRSALASSAAEDSMLRARASEPLTRPLDRYAGEFVDAALGTIRIERGPDGLHYRWGVLSGPVAVRDAARDQLRITFAGNGTLLTYTFANSPLADRLTIMRREFTRVRGAP